MLPVLMPEDFLALQEQNAQAAQAAALAGDTGALPGLDYSTADVQALGLPQPEPPPFQGQLPQLSPGDRASMGGSVSVSREGLTPEGKAIAGNLGDLKRRQGAENQRFNNENQYWQGQYDQTYGDASRAALNTGETAAQAMEQQAGNTDASLAAANRVGAALGMQGVQGSGEDLRAVAQEQVFNVEKAAADQFRADMQVSRAKFEGALARQEAMQIDPQRLMKNQAVQLTGAIAAVAAVSGKPGNMALSKALTDNLWNAVQTDVQGQMANMANQKSVTEGFQNLWNMTRQDSLTDLENKHKLNALYLGTVESHINALALKEQSKVTRAKYLELAAEIQQKKVEESSKAYNERARIHASRLETISQDARTAANVSVERARVAVAAQEAATKARELDMKAKAAAQEEAAKTQDQAVFDSTPDGKQLYLGQIQGASLNPAEAAKAKREVQAMLADGATVTESLSRLMDLTKAIRNRDTATIARMGIAGGIFGAKDELEKQLGTLQSTTAPKMANALGMNPISDVDIKSQVQAMGAEKVVDLIASRLGVDTNSERASAEMVSLIQRTARDRVRSFLRPPKDQQELDTVRQAYGDAAMFEEGGAYVPLPKVKNGSLVLEETAVPVARRDKAGREVETKLAPGAAGVGDIRKWSGQVNPMPGREAEARGVLSPAQETEIDRLQKGVNQYKPKEDEGDVQSKDEVAPVYLKFAKAQDKGGNKLDNGKPYIVSAFGGEGVTVPAYADEITELARIAHHSQDEDLRASALDVLESFKASGGSRWHYAEWALKHPGEFTAKGTGRITSGITE